MKTSISKILIIFLILISIFSIANLVFAADPFTRFDGVSIGGEGEKSPEGRLKNGLNVIIGIVQVVGVVAAVIILINLGIKYMSAAPGQRAEIKKNLTTYVVGIVLLFSFTGVLEIVKRFALGVSGT